jgi:hypothetical protein
MVRRGRWLQCLLLAGLLAWPRLALEPAGGRAPASVRADDGLVAPAARPPATLGLLLGGHSGGTAHRGAAPALPALPSLPIHGAAALADDRAAVADLRGARSPRFPTGPPTTLPTA